MTFLDRFGAAAQPLERAFGEAPVAIAVWRGPDHVYEFANPYYLRVFGRSDVIGRKVRDVFPERELADSGLWERLDSVYRTGEPFAVDEYVVEFDRRGTGARETAIFSFTLSPTRDAEGRIAGVTAVAIEQTSVVLARRQAETLAVRLREEEERLRLVQEGSQIGFVHYRALRDDNRQVRDFELLYQNSAASRTNHFPAGPNNSGLTMRSMFPNVEHSELWRGHVEAVESAVPSQEEVQYRDGRVDGWFRISRSRPEPEHLVIAFEDISESKRILEQQKEEAQTNEILLRVAGAISGLDLDAIVQTVTDEATSVCHAEFGAFFYNTVGQGGESYMLYTLSGVPKSAFERFPMPRNTAVFGPTFRGERVVRSDDITKERDYGQNAPYYGMPAGHLPVCSYLAVPVMSRDGRVLGGLFFGHAQPGRFTARDERTVSAIAQQAAVAMDNARLFELARRERLLAEEASRMKDDFLATISHELRTPLQSILGWAHMLRTGTLADATAARALEAVERNAKAQAALVEDMLDVSRIISGKLRIEVEPVLVADVVQAALDIVRPAADARSIRLQAILDPDAGTVMGDANRLQQVVWNLLINAVKFSSKGGRVYVHVRREKSSVEIVVADSGQGISAEFLPHVFERFRQFESGYSRKSGGLGLGLSIVKHVVELHGGTVFADSQGLGKGATLTVRIPVAPLSSHASSASGSFDPVRLPVPSECPPGLDGLRILVVDDEEDARDLLRTVLEHCRAAVTTAASASEAFTLLRDGRPDVLVSDIGMPDEDGYMLIEKVRALPAHAGGRTPAVALTAFARSEERSKALLKGFNHHVAKPVKLDELLVVIANLTRSFAT
jgi:signal transduction histidine kinase/CheY-like chemotaxis protein/PAS domain-containing protein